MRLDIVRVCVAILLCGAPASSPNAEAWGGATNVSFDVTLSGYSETWRDYYDPTYFRQYDYYCECYIEANTSLTGVAALYKPDGALYTSGIGNSPTYVLLVLSPFTPPQLGTWTGVSWHYGNVNWYDPGGYYCGGFTPCALWTDTYYLGSTTDQAVATATTVPATAKITVRSFIPEEWLWSPGPSNEIFGGNNRGFCEDCGTTKVDLWATYRNPALGQGVVAENPLRATWLTEAFDYYTSVDENSGHLLQSAKDDWTEGWPKKLAWGLPNIDGVLCDQPTSSQNTVWVNCYGWASDPLLLVAPPLDFDYFIELSWQQSHLSYDIEGCHDPYPAHELYIRGQGIVQDVHDGNPLSLFSVCGVEVYRDGWIQ